MSRKFYRNIKVIKFCRAPGCGVEFRPARGSEAQHIGLCNVHRRELYKSNFKAWFAKQPEGIQTAYKQDRYAVWLSWKEQHLARRREIALKSYHKLKKNKKGPLKGEETTP